MERACWQRWLSLSHPSANAAGASGSASFNPYDALANLSFNHWHWNCKDGSKKCLLCHNTSQDKPHNANNCPILKKIGLRLVNRSSAGTNAASQVGNDSPLPAQPPAPVTALPPSDNGGLGTAPGAFTITTELTVTILATILITRANTRAKYTILALNLVRPLTFTCPFQTIRACKFQLRQAPHLCLLPLWHATTQCYFTWPYWCSDYFPSKAYHGITEQPTCSLHCSFIKQILVPVPSPCCKHWCNRLPHRPRFKKQLMCANVTV